MESIKIKNIDIIVGNLKIPFQFTVFKGGKIGLLKSYTPEIHEKIKNLEFESEGKLKDYLRKNLKTWKI